MTNFDPDHRIVRILRNSASVCAGEIVSRLRTLARRHDVTLLILIFLIPMCLGASASADEPESKPVIPQTEISPLSPKTGKPRHSLRNHPKRISGTDASEVFGLKKDDEGWLRPLEYIENDFVDNKNGTITDRATGLMWQKSGSPTSMRFGETFAYIEKLNQQKFAGYQDWRLPTVDELKSLLTREVRSEGRYINPIFDSRQWWCWTSDKRVSGGVWFVDFRICSVNWLIDSFEYVRAVRSAP